MYNHTMKHQTFPFPSRTRQRVCTQGDEACNGGDVEEEACATNACPEYSTWGAWGYCSEDCGGGWQVRRLEGESGQI